MNRILLIVALLVISTSMASQKQLLDGYFINRQNEKIHCQLLLRKWNVIPEFFEYKTSPNAQTEKIKADFIKELAVFNTIKYLRTPIEIDPIYLLKDQSLTQLDTTSILLQQLIEGEANLYLLPSTRGDKFFYSVNNGPVAYLMYKKKEDNSNYRTMYSLTEVGNTSSPKNDYTFRSQLMNDLDNGSLNISHFQNLKYTATELIDIFNTFNSATSENHTEYAVCVRKKSNFRLRVKGGINLYDMHLPSRFITYKDRNISGIGYHAGVDLEVVFGKKNIWAVCSEPSLLASNERIIYGEGETNSHIESIIDYYTIQVPLAFRSYLLSSPNWSVFIQGGAAFEIPVNAKITKQIINGAELRSYNIKGAASFFSTMGISFRRTGIEYRYEFQKDLMKMTGITVDYSRSIISLSYRIK